MLICSQALIVSSVCAIGTGLVVAICIRQRRRREKPQYRFRHVLADNTDTPFLHLGRVPERSSSPDYEVHPYVHEILALKGADVQHTPPVQQDDPSFVPSVFWVNTRSQLETVIEELKVGIRLNLSQSIVTCV